MARFAIAGLQLELTNQDNLYRINAEIHKVMARFPWVQMVVVGELATLGPEPRHAQPLPSDIEAQYCSLAAQHGIWLVPGTLFERSGEDIFNTLPVINPAGEVVARYRKMFPFYPYEQGVSPGTEFVVFDVPDIGRMGVSICYDGWFPETTRTLAWMGAEVIIHPTMTNTIDRDLELAIARTNAAINQCYFVDINVAGRLGNGRSIVCGPEGNVIHEAGIGHEIIAFEADFGLVRRTRERGLMGLGQVLKSFRDSPVQFPPYREGHASPALDALGELRVPARGGPGPEVEP
ncbi:carbon-nitrogen hydrolase family protein [Haliea sp. E1-2-M8]|uniref:carbon-nitrogen hydrolase family protein n=1 Tax=Haliea sp. E1-2-M8 TaxID=3064706 RepID=UPI0027169E88|nr:carbon-nitrogen hydrolase family protein [Haliea sp. E1-2-M8]MDO8861597.1 carbon-nitrogen hydrolase family protein [Haliea sp. E1-2-M8]